MMELPGANIAPRYALLAACMMHVEGYYSTKSLAYRNSNPGNLEHPDGRFCVFTSKLAGYCALLDDILDNRGKALAAFLAKYAPPSENDSAMYLAVVSALSGVAPSEVL